MHLDKPSAYLFYRAFLQRKFYVAFTLHFCNVNLAFCCNRCATKSHFPIRYFFSPTLKQAQHISLIRHFHPRQAQNFRFFARKMLALQVLYMAQLGRNKVKHINIVVAIVNGVPTQACQRDELGVILQPAFVPPTAAAAPCTPSA